MTNETERHIRWAYNNMRYRCHRTASRDYPRYGGRGITICEEWEHSYPHFHRWAIDNGYQIGLSLDRIDNNGNYCPENCRFTTMRNQARNRSTTIQITDDDGEVLCFKDFCDKYEINYDTAYYRYRHGWTLKRIKEKKKNG